VKFISLCAQPVCCALVKLNISYNYLADDIFYALLC